MVGTSSVALLAFTLISEHSERVYVHPVFRAMDELELESARDALREGGRVAAARYLSRLDRLFGTSHYLLTAEGTDVLSGANRRTWLPSPPAVESRDFVGARFVVSHRSPDGQYWLLSVGPPVDRGGTFIPYYGVVLGAAAVLCMLAAVFIVVPLRRLARLVDRFGQGDLTVRSTWRRGDEIGRLSRSFDAMAGRIERLVLGERRLLEDVSHELRSPLARLKLAVKLVRLSPDPASALDRVDRHLERLTAVTSEIVELTRIEGDPCAHRWQAVDVGELIAETVEDCRLEAEPRGCDIHIEGQLATPIWCDRELVRRAVENVLRNAVRYSPERGRVELVLREDVEDITVAIRDHGPGVAEDCLELIFEAFFRADEARSSDRGGIGLGLSIAKRAVALHGGTIHAHNAHPGLCVTIKLRKKREPDDTGAAMSQVPVAPARAFQRF
jgi:signal transduction histidine kinase